MNKTVHINMIVSVPATKTSLLKYIEQEIKDLVDAVSPTCTVEEISADSDAA